MIYGTGTTSFSALPGISDINYQKKNYNCKMLFTLEILNTGMGLNVDRQLDP